MASSHTSLIQKSFQDALARLFSASSNNKLLRLLNDPEASDIFLKDAARIGGYTKPDAIIALGLWQRYYKACTDSDSGSDILKRELSLLIESAGEEKELTTELLNLLTIQLKLRDKWDQNLVNPMPHIFSFSEKILKPVSKEVVENQLEITSTIGNKAVLTVSVPETEYHIIPADTELIAALLEGAEAEKITMPEIKLKVEIDLSRENKIDCIKVKNFQFNTDGYGEPETAVFFRNLTSSLCGTEDFDKALSWFKNEIFKLDAQIPLTDKLTMEVRYDSELNTSLEDTETVTGNLKRLLKAQDEKDPHLQSILQMLEGHEQSFTQEKFNPLTMDMMKFVDKSKYQLGSGDEKFLVYKKGDYKYRIIIRCTEKESEDGELVTLVPIGLVFKVPITNLLILTISSMVIPPVEPKLPPYTASYRYSRTEDDGAQEQLELTKIEFDFSSFEKNEFIGLYKELIKLKYPQADNILKEYLTYLSKTKGKDEFNSVAHEILPFLLHENIGNYDNIHEYMERIIKEYDQGNSTITFCDCARLGVDLDMQSRSCVTLVY